MLRLLEDNIATPLGPLWVICDEQFRLRAVEWEQHSDRMEQLLDIHYRSEGYERIAAKNTGGLSDKLTAYFEGNLSIIFSAGSVAGAAHHPLRSGYALWSTRRKIRPSGSRSRRRRR